jgi:hypothetical protein
LKARGWTRCSRFPPASRRISSGARVFVAPAGNGAKLYFDSASGLLVRQVRYVDTAVGVIPTRIDYSDYRDVAGVKIAFRRVVTWTDGRSTIELSDVQPNARIDATRFAAPPPPKAK